jgi:hypothetical protein
VTKEMNLRRKLILLDVRPSGGADFSSWMSRTRNGHPLEVR